jgi:DNA-binding FadR family transcriptional regulator
MTFSGAVRTTEIPDGPPSVGSPVERRHASDQVFHELASAILNRELVPGTPLPPERELAGRFGVSRIVVREAIHRLKEYELVRVRQGSPTIVLDPDRAIDVRLLGLEIELVAPSRDRVDPFTERQIYSGAGLIELAEQRMTAEEVDELERLVDEFGAVEDKASVSFAFERNYWLRIAEGTRNRLYVRETAWHFNLLERDPRFRSAFTSSPVDRAHLYKSMIDAQRNRTGAAAIYLRALRAFNLPK